MSKTFLLSLSILLISFDQSLAQVWVQDFEIDALGINYFASSTLLNNSNAFYNRVSDNLISNSSMPYSNEQGIFYWAGENLDDTSIDGDGLNFKTLSFSPISIVGLTNLEFRGLFASGNPGNGWDYSDEFYAEYRVDFGPWEKLVQFATPSQSFNTGLYSDSDFDGIGEGELLTSNFKQFSKSISVAGGILEIRVFSSANGVSEEFAFDLFRLYDMGLNISGCTNPVAINFDITATVDDGNCQIEGCTDASALNYLTEANLDNGSCVYSFPQIVINEIHYNPSSFLGLADADFEFIELYNASAFDADISGWRLSHAVDYTFPLGFLLPAGAYVVVAANQLTYVVPGVQIVQFAGSLSNTGDVLDLRSSEGILIDQVKYYPNPSWPINADGNGPSIQLINFLLDNSDPLNWCGIGSSNGTPGIQNSCYTLIPGCTNPSASNYYVLAQVDDNSCNFPGCTYTDADNYNPASNLDDGTCVFQTDTCLGDLNQDMVVNSNDLLALLSVFGTNCP